MKDPLNELLGPSIFLLVLDLFLDHPYQWMNLREVARRVDKNPGSISRVIRVLLKRGLITDCKVGKVSIVYQLNYNNEKVQALMVLREKFKKNWFCFLFWLFLARRLKTHVILSVCFLRPAFWRNLFLCRLSCLCFAMLLESDPCVRVWRSRAGVNFSRQYSLFCRFLDEALSKDSVFTGMSLDELVEW